MFSGGEELSTAALPFARGHIGELFFHTRDAVAILDSDWRVRGWNPAGERLLGETEEKLRGQPFSGLFPDVDGFAELRRRLAGSEGGRQGASNAVVARLRSRAGRLIHARCRSIPLGAAPAGWRAVLIQEEPELEHDPAADLRLVQLYQLAGVAAAVMGETDQQKIAQMLVDLTKELLDADFTALMQVETSSEGFRVTSFTYNAPRHLFPGGVEHPRGTGLLAAALESRTILRIADIGRHPQAVGIPVEHPPIGPLLAVPLIANRQVIGELLAANRVDRRAFTELDEAIAAHIGTLAGAALDNARLHLEVATKAAELETLNLRRRQMVAAIAHDLRTPAGAVIGYADIACDPALPPNQLPAVLARLGEQATQLNRLVDDLSMASKVDTEQVTVELARVEVAPLLDELVADYRFRFPSRTFELVGQPVPLVLGDAARLRQVLTNLVDNALKYSPAGRPVRLEAAESRRRVLISVRDEGPGIAADEIGKIFEPFYRSRSSAGAAPGIGLGLTIARGLVAAMQGELTVESTPGQGACFTVSLPRAPVSRS
jgi:PAS domain S-box-containing protein